jgi:hypothetical protein
VAPPPDDELEDDAPPEPLDEEPVPAPLDEEPVPAPLDEEPGRPPPLDDELEDDAPPAPLDGEAGPPPLDDEALPAPLDDEPEDDAPPAPLDEEPVGPPPPLELALDPDDPGPVFVSVVGAPLAHAAAYTPARRTMPAMGPLRSDRRSLRMRCPLGLHRHRPNDTQMRLCAGSAQKREPYRRARRAPLAAEQEDLRAYPSPTRPLGQDFRDLLSAFSEADVRGQRPQAAWMRSRPDVLVTESVALAPVAFSVVMDHASPIRSPGQ